MLYENLYAHLSVQKRDTVAKSGGGLLSLLFPTQRPTLSQPPRAACFFPSVQSSRNCRRPLRRREALTGMLGFCFFNPHLSYSTKKSLLSSCVFRAVLGATQTELKFFARKMQIYTYLEILLGG